MRFFLLLCIGLFVPFATFAETDFFAALTGDYGRPFSAEYTCQKNPHHVSFSADHRRALFEWRQDIMGYDGSVRKTAEYTVLGSNSVGIIMRLDGESRLTDTGEPVVWIMRPTLGVDGYCWGRTDWPEAQCIAPHIRCPDPELGA